MFFRCGTEALSPRHFLDFFPELPVNGPEWSFPQKFPRRQRAAERSAGRAMGGGGPKARIAFFLGPQGPKEKTPPIPHARAGESTALTRGNDQSTASDAGQ